MLTLERKLIEVEKLKIPEVVDRETVDELKASMIQNGLLHPIVVRADMTVHAGKRRAQAAVELKWGQIQCAVLPEGVTEDQLKEIEIQENLVRRNLPWYDSVILKKELFDMRQRQLGKGKQGRRKVGFSLRDLAEELQEGLGTLSQDLRLAEAVLANPGLKKLEDKSTAQRLVFNMARRIEAETEAALPSSVDPEIVTNVVLCGDSTAVLKNFPDRTFDVCFTDPPWLQYRDSTLIKDEWTLPVFEEVYRVLKTDSFLYVICSIPDFSIYSEEFEKIGFSCQKQPLFWHKLNHLTHGLRNWEYSRDFEPILLAVKGNPVLTQSTPPSSIYTSRIVHNTKQIHPNEKPIDVAQHFLEHCSYEGSLVLDPFGGSGATAEACIKSRRKYVIIERDKSFADGIESRLRSLDAAL